MLRSITDDEYDKFYQSFREKVSEIDTQLSMLQEVEDNYYLSAKYLLELANRAYELFESSEVEERRQLIKLVLSNIRVENDLVRYDAIKPFDTILNYDHRLSLLLGKDSNL
jgi:predicted ribosome quality control (RQC) complex YloA/Tae2 family protein